MQRMAKVTSRLRKSKSKYNRELQPATRVWKNSDKLTTMNLFERVHSSIEKGYRSVETGAVMVEQITEQTYDPNRFSEY